MPDVGEHEAPHVVVVPLALLAETQDTSPHLDIWHVRRDLMQVVETAAIHVLVWEMTQQAVHRADAQFPPQQFGAFPPVRTKE